MENNKTIEIYKRLKDSESYKKFFKAFKFLFKCDETKENLIKILSLPGNSTITMQEICETYKNDDAIKLGFKRMRIRMIEELFDGDKPLCEEGGQIVMDYTEELQKKELLEKIAELDGKDGTIVLNQQTIKKLKLKTKEN